MAIDLATGFNIGSKDAIDERQVLTLEQMKNLDESIYPDKYFAICKDDGKLYLYDADNEINDETGKFREISGSDNIVDTDNFLKSYTELSQLGLSSDVGVWEVIQALAPGAMAHIRTNGFDNASTIFPITDSGVLYIVKGKDDVYLHGTQVMWTSKQGGCAIGVIGSGSFDGWNVLSGSLSSNKKLIFNNRFTINDYTLLAKIVLPDDSIYRHNIRITCAHKINTSNYSNWTFEEDIDICKFDLHFTNPPLTAAYVDDPTIKLYGLTLYEYPFPEGTDEGIKKISKNIRLYYDKTSYTIYVYLFNNENLFEGEMGRQLIGLTVENKGDIEIAESLLSDGVWNAPWNCQCEFDDLEAPTIVKVGGGSDSTTTTYTSLTELGLTADATVQDVVDALSIGDTALLRTDGFTNWSTLFNGIQWGYLKVEKTVNGLSNIELQEVVTPNRRYFGTQAGGKFDKWQAPIDQFHRIIAQENAGYFKFKPCSNPTVQGIRITATDNYGGMIDISGVTPTQTQYKPFKCVRLSHSTYTDYNAGNPANNKMEKLFVLDGYMYLKVVAYTTVTFTNLIEEPTFVEAIDETAAEEIPIVSAILPQFDAYGDPYIVSIGESVSGDGSIQTLASLGLPTDIMKWKTGTYKVSHVSGLTGLPSDIINTSPGFRLEHHNIKKWMSGHGPHKDTWGQRHSIIYCDNGSVYHRFYESGATAGTYIKDTGWQQLITENSKTTDPYSCTGYTALTGTEDLFTLPCGHYASAKVDTAYNYPITDSSNVTAHIYVLGCLNEPANNKGYRIILYFDNKGRMYSINEWWGSFGNGWQKIGASNTLSLVTNSQYFKINITKKNAAWYGNLKFSYVYGKTPTEIDIAITSTIDYTITKGTNTINSITYTVDGANITIGIKCTSTMYGTQTVEMPSEFGTINSLTAEEFTGTTTATLRGVNGYNVYSTTEQAVGTWIDGSTVYRTTIAYTFDSASSADTSINIGNVSGCKLVVKMEGVLQKSRYEFKPLPYYLSSSNYGQVTFLSSTGNVSYSGSALSEGAQIFVTMEYTKS